MTHILSPVVTWHHLEETGHMADLLSLDQNCLQLILIVLGQCSLNPFADVGLAGLAKGKKEEEEKTS